MAVTIQLKSFTVKTAPVPADIMYLGDSANSFDEVQSTVAEVIGAYPALVSIGSLTTTANEIIYTTGSNTYATAPITAFGLSVLALSAGVTTPTAGDFATWDAHANLSASNFLAGFQAIPSAAGNTVLTVSSPQTTQITGSTTQTVTMPVVSTLAIGTPYKIINSSTGAVTVNSSGGNLIQTLAAGTAVELNSILTSGTSAASWYSIYLNPADLSGAVLLAPSAAQTILTYPLNLPGGVYTPTILDSNANTMAAFNTVASAVNYFSFMNSATGNGPTLQSAGSDAVIAFNLGAKGAAPVNFSSEELTNQYTFFSGTALVHSSIMNFPATAAARTYTWPDASGTIALTAGSGGLKSFQILTSGTAATYTRPAGITSILVEAVGGGGGGGGAAISTGGGAAGGGGASGGYCRLWVAAAAATYTYTVGAGGAGGTAGNNNGAAGTSTTFVGTGANIAAALGGGGIGSAISTTSAAQGAFGSPSSSSGGDVNINGGTGNYGYTTNAAGTGFTVGGYGGNSYFGGGGVFNPAAATGSAAVTNSGGGGSGGGATNNGSAFAGGAGADGIIIVWEFA